MTLLQWVLASAAVGAGACIQGTIGFGLNLVAAPVLLLVDTSLVPGPAVFLALVLTTLTARRERAFIDVPAVGWALLGRVPGVALGALALVALPTRGVVAAFVAAVLAGVVMSALDWRLQPTRMTLLGAGAVSGVMGTAASIGGPPMALLYQRSPGPTIRATLSAYFAVGVVTSLTALAAVGRFGTAEVRAALLLVPALVAGYLASGRAAAVLDRGWTRAGVLALSAGSALALLVSDVFA